MHSEAVSLTPSNNVFHTENQEIIQRTFTENALLSNISWVNLGGYVIAKSHRILSARLIFNILSDKSLFYEWKGPISSRIDYVTFIQSSYAYMRTQHTYNTADCHTKWENEQ